MLNRYANRFIITVSDSIQPEIEAWLKRSLSPYHKRAVKQSIQLFIAGISGRLKPPADITYLPYPALTAHGSDSSPEAEAFGEWIKMLQADCLLDDEHCQAIDQCYKQCGLDKVSWDDLTADEKEKMEMMRFKADCDRRLIHWPLITSAELSGSLRQIPDNDELMALCMPTPARLAREINWISGGLFDETGYFDRFYFTYYNKQWTADNNIEMARRKGKIQIDVDTVWEPLAEQVVKAVSAYWNCQIDHYFSEKGGRFCSLRQYSAGELTECIDEYLECDDKGEDGCSEVIFPEWI